MEEEEEEVLVAVLAVLAAEDGMAPCAETVARATGALREDEQVRWMTMLERTRRRGPAESLREVWWVLLLVLMRLEEREVGLRGGGSGDDDDDDDGEGCCGWVGRGAEVRSLCEMVMLGVK